MIWCTKRPKPWAADIDCSGLVAEKTSAEPEVKDMKPDCDEADVDAKLEEFKREDAAAFERSKTYVPEVGVTEYPNGRWLSFGDVEVPLQHIVSVEMAYGGTKPRRQLRPGYGINNVGGVYYAEKAGDACIEIGVVSGLKKQVYCDRHVVDFVLVALRNAWKGIDPESSQ